MDRRDFVKGAGAFAASGLGMSGLSESVSGTYGMDTSKMRLVERVKFRVPPYDPVAVLEAMREVWRSREMCCQLTAAPMGYYATSDGIDSLSFPDFLSAVKWLHRQAAAVNAAFAEKWPVPE